MKHNIRSGPEGSTACFAAMANLIDCIGIIRGTSKRTPGKKRIPVVPGFCQLAIRQN